MVNYTYLVIYRLETYYFTAVTTMYRVLLVQNLSEMRNYAYADARSMLQSMGFDYELFTMENISDLSGCLLDGNTDLLLLASNCLNDVVVKDYLFGEEFRNAFSAYLAQEKPCLILHQNGIARKSPDEPFPFLATELPYKLKSNYKTADGIEDLRFTGCFYQEYFEFPNKIHPSDIIHQCQEEQYPKGLHWTALEDEHKQWLPILKSSADVSLISKHSNHSVIYSSLLLDLQDHRKLLENMIINLIVNNNSLAILGNDHMASLGYNYFLNALKASKLHYIIYRENGTPSCQDLFANIRLGLHSTLLIAPEAKEIIKNDYDSITAQGVKIIEIKNEDIDKRDSYIIHATEKNIRCAFAEAEVKVQRMLMTGFINGSFMKTIDVLKILLEFQEMGITKGSYNKETLRWITTLIEQRIKPNGSFDDTSLPSIKALWYYKNIVGKNEPIAKKLENYVTTYTCNYCVHLRELVEELKTVGNLSLEAAQQLRQQEVVKDFLAPKLDKQKRYNEYDVLAVLEVAGLLHDTAILKNVLNYLEANLSHGVILNTHLTATFTSTLIEQYNLLPDNEPLKGQMQDLLFEMVAYLKKELDVLLETDADDKYIDTTLHIIHALYAFETIVSFPITDLINLVFRSGNYPNMMLEFGKSIVDIQQTRMEVGKYKEDIKAYKNLRSYRTWFYVFAGLSVALFYLCISLLLTAMNYDDFRGTLMASLLDAWPALFSGALIPFTKVIVKRIRGKDNQ